MPRLVVLPGLAAVLAVVVLVLARDTLRAPVCRGAARGRVAERALDAAVTAGQATPPPNAPENVPPETDPFGWTLSGQYRIRGRVVDDDGRAVAGARIRYQPSYQWYGIDDGGWFVGGRLHPHRTEDDGSFTIDALGPCEVALLAGKRGYTVTPWIDSAAGDESLVVILRRAESATVSGRVIFDDGRPAANAQLSGAWFPTPDPLGDPHDVLSVIDDALYSTPGEPEPDAGLPEPEPRTDADGGFVQEVEAGDTTLGAEVDGWRGEVALSLRPGERRDGVSIVLRKPPKSMLRLRVLLSDGRPLAHHELRIQHYSGPDTTTDAQGRYTGAFDEPPGTDISVVVLNDPEPRVPAYATTVATVPRGASDETVIRLPKPVRVTVLVRDREGRVPLGAEVRDMAYDDGSAPAESDPAAGWFLFEAIPGSENEYLATAPGYRSAVLEVNVPAYSDVFRIGLEREARVQGRVLEADGTGAAPLVRPSGSHVDGGGRFDMSVAPRGDAVEVVTGLDGFPFFYRFPAFRREVNQAPGESLDLGDIVLPAWDEVTGVVTGADGEPVGGVLLAAVRRELGDQAYGVAKRDGFRLRVRRGTPLRVLAWKPGRGIALSQPVTVPARVRLKLVREAHVALPSGDDLRLDVVTTDDGFPLSGLWPDRLPALPPGLLRFRFRDARGEAVDRTLRLVPGDRAELVLR